MPGWWRDTGEGVALVVRLTPKAAADAVDGVCELADGARALQVRVTAAPHAGAANRALEILLARRLGVPKSSVAVERGHSSRLKTVAIAAEADSLAGLLERLGAGKEHARTRGKRRP